MFRSGGDDVVSAMNTVLGTKVVVVVGVSVKNTVCRAGVGGAFVVFAMVDGCLDTIGFSLIGMLQL